MSPFVSPIVCAETLIEDLRVDQPRPVYPALVTSDASGSLVPHFRPLVLRDVLDANNGLQGCVPTQTHVVIDEHDDILHITEPGTPTYTAAIHLTGHVRMTDDTRRWSLAPEQPHWGAARTGSLGTVATPDRRIESAFVTAPVDVEQLDPEQWVTVAERRIVPARRQLLIVKAGAVALFEPQHHRDDQPENLDDDEAWLPRCYHCGRDLLDSGSIPGMPYPMPDDSNPWCPQHTDPSGRARPCAATWALHNYTTGAVMDPADEGFARHRAEQSTLARKIRAQRGF